MSLPSDSAERKRYPLYEGFLKYFPDAAAAVAKLSYDGNQKHNPGEPLHWAKDKSTDHQDCVIRHMLDALEAENQGDVLRQGEELTAEAWRALAALQVWFDNNMQAYPTPAHDTDTRAVKQEPFVEWDDDVYGRR